MYKEEFIEDATKGLLECVLWIEAAEGCNPRLTKASRVEARKLVKEFVEAAGDLMKDYSMSASQFGHDLWLTSNGHGAGFWDRAELQSDKPYKFTVIDRDGKAFEAETCGIGKALTELAYSDKISRFELVDTCFYRGWLYFEGVDRVIKARTGE